MKKRLLCIIALVFVYAVSYSETVQADSMSEFNEKMKGLNLEFIMPAGFVPFTVDLKKCEDVKYYHAIKHKVKKLEVRYSMFPYEKAVNEKDHMKIGSDELYKMFTYTVIANIAGEDRNILKTLEFEKGSVRQEFNADWGFTCIVRPASEFGSGYKLALITSLYKSGSGYAYIIFLFDDFKDIQKEYLSAFYSFRFTGEK